MPPKRNTKKSSTNASDIDTNNDNKNDNDSDSNNKESMNENISKTNITSMDLHVPIYPYTNKTSMAPVMLEPLQLDNDLEYHIKNNLKILHEGKIFKDYGYISKIHKIESYSKPIIEAENFSCSAITKVNFSFEICVPVVNRYIICKIDEVVKELIKCSNGNILSLINSNRINQDVFYKDQNRNFRIKDENNSFLAENMFVKIFVLGNKINYKEQILAIGTLENIATEDKVKQYYYNNKNK